MRNSGKLLPVARQERNPGLSIIQSTVLIPFLLITRSSPRLTPLEIKHYYKRRPGKGASMYSTMVCMHSHWHQITQTNEIAIVRNTWQTGGEEGSHAWNIRTISQVKQGAAVHWSEELPVRFDLVSIEFKCIHGPASEKIKNAKAALSHTERSEQEL